MFYVAHRLFAFHDRAVAALVADTLATRVGVNEVFLPFCDTNEEEMSAAGKKGQRLYELDRERLVQLDGMIAILHGPSLDDGVCMEIGFARRLDVPVVLLTTDFQSYGPFPTGPELIFAEPLLETLASGVVRVHRLGQAPLEQMSRYQVFMHRNLAPLRKAATSAVDMLLSLQNKKQDAPTAGSRQSDLVYLEPSPYFPSADWETFIGILREKNWKIEQAERVKLPSDASRADLLASSRRDWAAVAAANLLVADLNGPETPAGAALMIGSCAATGCRVLGYYATTSHTFAPGREPNFRNLMVQYSTTAAFRDAQEFRSALSYGK
jgi:hypothetical protein